nr:serine/threonine-protein kinase bri1-like 2 [Quercus suber]
MLEILSLGKNQLSGELPHHWNDSKFLMVVDIANNNLSGKIPNSMGFLNSLEVLVLSNNNLYGEIPSSLRNCSLRSIDLGGNYLSGNLPSRIGSHVLMLRLRSNLFSGIIPRQCNSYFGVQEYQEETILVTKGQELLYGRILEFVSSIDLSGNHLTGEIPNELSRLIKLGTVNLSINHLTGNIPQCIGNLRWLESLDLSKNSLSGPIPKSLSYLTFLAHLNLSFNNLVGKIPSDNQLQTLNDASIYKSNPSLCGSPLPTKCPGDETFDGPTITSGSVDDKQDGDDYESTQNAQVGSALLHKDDGTTPKMQAQFIRQKNKGVQSDTVPSVKRGIQRIWSTDSGETKETQPEQPPEKFFTMATQMSQDSSVKAFTPIRDTKRGNSSTSSQLGEVLLANRSSLSPFKSQSLILKRPSDLISNEKKF